MLSLNTVGLDLTNNFLQSFEADHPEEQTDEAFVKISARTFSAWVAVEAGFNKVSANVNYAKLLKTFTRLIIENRSTVTSS